MTFLAQATPGSQHAGLFSRLPTQAGTPMSSPGTPPFFFSFSLSFCKYNGYRMCVQYITVCISINPWIPREQDKYTSKLPFWTKKKKCTPFCSAPLALSFYLFHLSPTPSSTEVSQTMPNPGAIPIVLVLVARARLHVNGESPPVLTRRRSRAPSFKGNTGRLQVELYIDEKSSFLPAEMRTGTAARKSRHLRSHRCQAHVVRRKKPGCNREASRTSRKKGP